MIIALNLGDIDIIIALTHAVYDYRLEPGDIDIIIALTRQFMISPRTWCYRYYYRHDARRNYDYRRTTWRYHLFISP
jgi:hypothetical protein